MKRIFIILIASCSLFSCSGDAPSETAYLIDTSYFSDGFRGVTYTDESSNIIGNVDRDDWRLFYGRSIFSYATSTTEPQTSDLPNMAKIIPSNYKLNPAYPNPSDGSISLSVAVPVASQILITVVDKEFNILYQSQESSEAGVHSIYISLTDYVNPYYQRNIYRIYFDINNNITGYGDVMIIK